MTSENTDVIGFATLPLAVMAERRILFIASGESLRLCTVFSSD